MRMTLIGWLVLALCTGAAAAESPLAVEGPAAPAFAVPGAEQLRPFAADRVDRTAALAEDAPALQAGSPPRFALPQAVSLTPETHGQWHELNGDYLLWRLRVTSRDALSLNFGFDRFRLPKNSRLTIHPTDSIDAGDPRGVRSFNETDNPADGRLWTPVVVADDVVVELVLPRVYRHDYELEVGSINRGYSLFGENLSELSSEKSGACNIDVVCPEGDPWRTEISSVGVYTINGTWYCSGAMINNTARDETPYFLTANHCGVSTSNDQGVVIYWNFESPTCGAQSGGSLAQFNSGVVFLAASATSDYALVQLEEPLDPSFQVAYAGWDRSGDDPATAVAIHHPSTDEKSISFENDPLTTTAYLGTGVPGDGTHFRVEDWDLGTTEGGSSGSPLFDSAHRIVGQLHGGYAACGNDLSDWYGKMSVSWSGLETYLDPLGTGAVTLDTFAPWVTGLIVASGDFEAAGDVGGPFEPAGTVYNVFNQGTTTVDYQVTADVPWLDVIGGSGTLIGNTGSDVAVVFNAAAEALGQGTYTGTLTFTNLTNSEGDATRTVVLQVGLPALVYSEPLDSDPNWDTQGDWAFGVPVPGTPAHGFADPASGFTGTNVYGYNLTGDYTSFLPQTHLTSTAFDCSDLSAVSVRFRRWLNVEQPLYDHAYVSVSNDGSTWTEVWTNGAEIVDNAWQAVEYDISGVADGQATVYLRWTMGTTDESWEYSGWNIDDVEIWGIRDYVASAGGVPARAAITGNRPNPFNPSTEIAFTLGARSDVRLEVFDLQGRRVRELLVGSVSAGDHRVRWDGLDDGGRPAGSGVYLARLVADGRVDRHKMVMLK